MRVVFHVPEASRSRVCLNNTSNYLQLMNTRPLLIKVVFNSDGVKTLLAGEEIAGRWQNLLEKAGNVHLLVCNNSLAGFNLSLKQLITPVEVVPAAVFTLVQLQQQGWVYLRP